MKKVTVLIMILLSFSSVYCSDSKGSPKGNRVENLKDIEKATQPTTTNITDLDVARQIRQELGQLYSEPSDHHKLDSFDCHKLAKYLKQIREENKAFHAQILNEYLVRKDKSDKRSKKPSPQNDKKDDKKAASDRKSKGNSSPDDSTPESSEEDVEDQVIKAGSAMMKFFIDVQNKESASRSEAAKRNKKYGICGTLIGMAGWAVYGFTECLKARSCKCD